MATKKTATPEQAQEALHSLSLTGENSLGLTYEECFDILEGADRSKLEVLTGEYYKFDKPGVYTFMVEKIEKATIQGKELEVAHVRTRNGDPYIMGQTVFVNACKKMTVFPGWISVEFKGMKQTGTNKYFDLDVRTFPASK